MMAMVMVMMVVMVMTSTTTKGLKNEHHAAADATETNLPNTHTRSEIEDLERGSARWHNKTSAAAARQPRSVWPH